MGNGEWRRRQLIGVFEWGYFQQAVSSPPVDLAPGFGRLKPDVSGFAPARFFRHEWWFCGIFLG